MYRGLLVLNRRCDRKGLDRLETQLGVIDEVGLQNYLQSQLKTGS